MKVTHGICDDAVIATCHTVHVFMLWQQYVVTWYTCSCCDSNVTWYTCSWCDSNMPHGTCVHAVTATCCHTVHVFMLWQQYVVTRYTCSCCDSNMLSHGTCSCCDSNMSHGTSVHAVTATCCHMVHVFMLWQQHVVTWYMCSCCDSSMLSHDTRVHAVTAICCHVVHVFML